MADAASVVNGGDGGNGGAAWHDSFDADTKGWISAKGWDKLDATAVLPELVKGYRGAEQKLGVPADQLLRLPKDDNDAEGWKAALTRLGAPENPEDYGLKAPDGDSGEFLKTAAGWFHELGVPKRIASGLAAKWGEYVEAQKAAMDAQWNQRFDTEIAALKAEWGDGYDKNVDLAKRVMGAFGYSPEQLKAIERAVGPKAMLMGFSKFGAAIGEHRFVEGSGQHSFGESSLEDKIAALRRDPEYMKDSPRGREIAQKIYDLTQQDTRLANQEIVVV